MLRLLICPLLISTVLSMDYVTCGSVLKLQNQNEGSRLHSHDVKYGSGSGQQSVTAVANSDDNNSHWQLHSALRSTCARGERIQCGSLIRLLHLNTGCFLHSHHFQAPLSKSAQEVSCFGTPTESDTGDNWQVLCSGDSWEETDAIKLKHVDTGVFLALSGTKFGRPIHGQREVVGVSSPNSLSYWVAAEGVYMSS